MKHGRGGVIVICSLLSVAGADPVADDEALGLAKDARVIEPRGIAIDRTAADRAPVR